MLNEVFIAVGTMSVSPGSRWRNRPREKEPGVEGRGGRRRRGGFSWKADPVLVLIWESGDPTGKHAAVSCHLCRHVIERKVPLPPGTRGRCRGPNLRQDRRGAASAAPTLPSRSRAAVLHSKIPHGKGDWGTILGVSRSSDHQTSFFPCLRKHQNQL